MFCVCLVCLWARTTGRRPWCRTCDTDYICQLAWEHPGIPAEELKGSAAVCKDVCLYQAYGCLMWHRNCWNTFTPCFFSLWLIFVHGIVRLNTWVHEWACFLPFQSVQELTDSQFIQRETLQLLEDQNFQKKYVNNNNNSSNPYTPTQPVQKYKLIFTWLWISTILMHGRFELVKLFGYVTGLPIFHELDYKWG